MEAIGFFLLIPWKRAAFLVWASVRFDLLFSREISLCAFDFGVVAAFYYQEYIHTFCNADIDLHIVLCSTHVRSEMWMEFHSFMHGEVMCRGHELYL